MDGWTAGWWWCDHGSASGVIVARGRCAARPLTHIVRGRRDTALTPGAPVRVVCHRGVSADVQARGMNHDGVDAMIRSAIGGDVERGFVGRGARRHDRRRGPDRDGGSARAAAGPARSGRDRWQRRVAIGRWSRSPAPTWTGRRAGRRLGPRPPGRLPGQPDRRLDRLRRGRASTRTAVRRAGRTLRSCCRSRCSARSRSDATASSCRCRAGRRSELLVRLALEAGAARAHRPARRGPVGRRCGQHPHATRCSRRSPSCAGRSGTHP